MDSDWKTPRPLKIKLLLNHKTQNMNRFSLSIAAVLFVLTASLSSCSAIGGIFKAGMWTGIIAIAVVVFIILYFISRSRK